MKPYLTLLPVISFLFLQSCNQTAAPPNVVFILVDDLGWKDLGCYGSSFYETPNIDVLARRGVRFTNAYAASPVCSPTRAALMTGKHPARVGITDWIPGSTPGDRKLRGPEDLHQLPLDEYTLAEAFRDQGYTTFFAGKWHLGGEGFFPEDQGFDINKGGHDKGSPPGGYYAPYKNPKLADGPDGEYLTNRLTDEAMHFVDTTSEQPFFLMLSFYTVHTPIQASNRHIEYYEAKRHDLPEDGALQQEPEHEGVTTVNQVNADYASMVAAMDENVGRLLDKLETLGLADNTFIVFTSDNGGLSTLPPNRIAGPTSVRPLRAGKGWCYEGGIRVPLIVAGPGIPSQEKTNNTAVVSMDLYPTLLDAAGLPPKPEQHRDGLSLTPLFQGKSLDREALYWHYPHYHGSAWTPGAAIRAGDWKLVEFYHYEKTELYHLAEDIGEQQDLAEQFPERVKELKQQLKEMQRETGAKMPLENEF